MIRFWKMRIWFGLILKIMVRMKSHTPQKYRYFTKQPDSDAKLSLFSGSHPNYSTHGLDLLFTAVYDRRVVAKERPAHRGSEGKERQSSTVLPH